VFKYPLIGLGKWLEWPERIEYQRLTLHQIKCKVIIILFIYSVDNTTSQSPSKRENRAENPRRSWKFRKRSGINSDNRDIFSEMAAPHIRQYPRNE
jgi:hypothetical protein